MSHARPSRSAVAIDVGSGELQISETYNRTALLLGFKHHETQCLEFEIAVPANAVWELHHALDKLVFFREEESSEVLS